MLNRNQSTKIHKYKQANEEPTPKKLTTAKIQSKNKSEHEHNC